MNARFSRSPAVDALGPVHFHLSLEYDGIEEELELFVCKVNAKLLKGVDFEELEPEYVQHTNGKVSFALVDSVVDLANEPVEYLAVDFCMHVWLVSEVVIAGVLVLLRSPLLNASVMSLAWTPVRGLKIVSDGSTTFLVVIAVVSSSP